MHLYKSAKTFIKDMTDPFVISLKLIMEERLNTLRNAIRILRDRYLLSVVTFQSAILNFLASSRLEIYSTESEMTTNYNESTSDLMNHINNVSNPHQVRPNQVTTISTLPPSSAQGSVGDVWVEYNNS